MKILFVYLMATLITYSCTSGTINPSGIKKEAAMIAEKYIKGNVKAKSKKNFDNGITAIGDFSKVYILDTSRIYTGYIDSDSIPEAIMTLDIFKNGRPDISEQLLMISEGGKLRIVSVIESDFKIISISNGIITADVPTHQRNSPLFNCPECREIIRYRFKKGELVKAE